MRLGERVGWLANSSSCCLGGLRFVGVLTVR